MKRRLRRMPGIFAGNDVGKGSELDRHLAALGLGTSMAAMARPAH